jgi:hypothetical protein
MALLGQPQPAIPSCGLVRLTRRTMPVRTSASLKHVTKLHRCEFTLLRIYIAANLHCCELLNRSECSPAGMCDNGVMNDPIWSAVVSRRGCMFGGSTIT